MPNRQILNNTWRMLECEAECAAESWFMLYKYSYIALLYTLENSMKLLLTKTSLHLSAPCLLNRHLRCKTSTRCAQDPSATLESAIRCFSDAHWSVGWQAGNTEGSALGEASSSCWMGVPCLTGRKPRNSQSTRQKISYPLKRDYVLERWRPCTVGQTNGKSRKR